MIATGNMAMAAARTVIVDPEARGDWDSVLEVFPERTVFHGRNWARVLRETYGHKSVYVARFEGDRLTGLLPLMEVSSWLTGRRGVSLPFADFCVPLSEERAREGELYRTAMELGRERGWRYLECRGNNTEWEKSRPSLSFHNHIIDLEADENELFNRCNENTRRGARKAEKMGVQVKFDTSLEAMKIFHELHCKTRRKHGVPPQPWRFFENIQRHILAPGGGFVAIAQQQNQTAAAAVFFHEGTRALYKFGASDEALLRVKPNPLLFVKAMGRCKAAGCAALNLGRTSTANEGLRRFKLAFGAREETIEYRRYDYRRGEFVVAADRSEGWATKVFGQMPIPLLRLLGRALYPHLS